LAAPAKTAGTQILALQNVATGAVLLSAAIDVSVKFAAMVCVHVGRTNNSAPTTALQVRIEASAKEDPNEAGFWFPLAIFTSSINAITSQAVNGTCNSGQAVVPMASTTGETLSDLVYVKNSTIANGEFGVVKIITSNVSVTIEDNLVNAQTGSTVYPNAQRFAASLDLSAVKRLRVVANNNNGGVGFDVDAYMVTLDTVA
jgi:hypothetical protein